MLRFAKNPNPDLPHVALAVGDLSQPGVDEVLARPLQERADLVLDMAERAQRLSTQVSSSRCTYNEIHNHKAIVTTDGADVEYQLVRPEFRIHVVAERDGELMSASNGMGVTGDGIVYFAPQRKPSLNRSRERPWTYCEQHILRADTTP